MHAQQKTATIYQFPTRVRGTIARAALETQASAELRNSRTPRMTFGAGWYHDAAIEDAGGRGKRR